MKKTEIIKKLWNKDASLWTNQGEDKWLGWLDLPKSQFKRVHEFSKIQNTFKKYRTIGLLGMGGSSLCPEVLEKTFGSSEGFPKLFVLDSTDPAQVRSFQRNLDLSSTCFIVSSKSGSTLEPNVFLEYFYDLVKERNFVAVTDPGSAMEKKAEKLKFLDIFYGIPSVGGRYSALSDFGIIPALALGINIEKYLKNTLKMVEKCGPNVALESNPGFMLGDFIAENALNGRDKMTLVSSPGLRALPAWIEQLVAESTGKNGKGIIPVVEDELHDPKSYGKDRQFIYLKLKSDGSSEHDKKLAELKKAGFSVLILETEDIYDLGQEFFRWEVATAVAGSILELNPFDQPDVEASKVATRQLTVEFEKVGYLPSENPIFEKGNIKLFTNESNKELLEQNKPTDLSAYFKAHFERVGPGDYVGLLAYLEMSSENEKVLKEIKSKLERAGQTATCIGFGPRFLHSTGQAYKGGPNTGVFLQITSEPQTDLQIPGQKYTFGVVEGAQALGDFQVLAHRDRRMLRVHIVGSVKSGLEQVRDAIG